jgi:hypothetical protein
MNSGAWNSKEGERCDESDEKTTPYLVSELPIGVESGNEPSNIH